MVAKILKSVPEHLEYHLGEISRGWAHQDFQCGIKVVSFESQPYEHIVTYSTLGLSEVTLDLPRQRKVRQELVMSAHVSFPADEIAGFMLSYAKDIADCGRAVLRGEVIDPVRPLIKGATVSAVYATNPTPFDDAFAEFSNVDPPVIFVLLVPVTKDEVSLLRREGWNWFEDMVELQDPDIWDFMRLEQVRKL